jgi:hypothetical protein
MKKILLFSVLSLFIILVGCSSDGKDNIYGEYIFEEVSYLSPISSSLKESLNERMKNSTYLIQEDLYKVQSSEVNIEVISPKYVKEKIDADSLALFDTNFFRMNNIQSQYSIYDQKDNRTNSMLFVSPNDIWIAINTNVAPNGQLVIFYLFKLSNN